MRDISPPRLRSVLALCKAKVVAAGNHPSPRQGGCGLSVNRMLQLRGASFMLHHNATLMSYDLRSTQSKALWIVTVALFNQRSMEPFLTRWPLLSSPSGEVMSVLSSLETSVVHLRVTESVRPCVELA